MTNLTAEQYAAEIAKFVIDKGIDYSNPELFMANIDMVLKAHLTHQQKLTDLALQNIDQVAEAVYELAAQ